MTKVNCTGEEDSLFFCDFTGWQNHSCPHDEDAAVICTGNEHFGIKGGCGVIHIEAFKRRAGLGYRLTTSGY